MSEALSPTQPPKVGFVSLGCPKALVDSERILTQLRLDGFGNVVRMPAWSSFAGGEIVALGQRGG